MAAKRRKKVGSRHGVHAGVKVEVYVTEQQRERWREAAGLSGETLSEWIRRAADATVQK